MQLWAEAAHTKLGLSEKRSLNGVHQNWSDCQIGLGSDCGGF